MCAFGGWNISSAKRLLSIEIVKLIPVIVIPKSIFLVRQHNRHITFDTGSEQLYISILYLG